MVMVFKYKQQPQRGEVSPLCIEQEAKGIKHRKTSFQAIRRVKHWTTFPRNIVKFHFSLKVKNSLEKKVKKHLTGMKLIVDPVLGKIRNMSSSGPFQHRSTHVFYWF